MSTPLKNVSSVPIPPKPPEKTAYEDLFPPLPASDFDKGNDIEAGYECSCSHQAEQAITIELIKRVINGNEEPMTERETKAIYNEVYGECMEEL